MPANGKVGRLQLLHALRARHDGYEPIFAPSSAPHFGNVQIGRTSRITDKDALGRHAESKIEYGTFCALAGSSVAHDDLAVVVVVVVVVGSDISLQNGRVTLSIRRDQQGPRRITTGFLDNVHYRVTSGTTQSLVVRHAVTMTFEPSQVQGVVIPTTGCNKLLLQSKKVVHLAGIFPLQLQVTKKGMIKRRGRSSQPIPNVVIVHRSQIEMPGLLVIIFKASHDILLLGNGITFSHLEVSLYGE